MKKKNTKNKVNATQYIGWAILALILVLFTGFSFYWEQPCDGIDNIFLYCRQTGTIGDWIGNIMFYSGALFLGGITNFLGLELYNPTNSARWNIISFVGLVISIILIWNF